MGLKVRGSNPGGGEIFRMVSLFQGQSGLGVAWEIIWTCHVRNEVLKRVKDARNILCLIQRGKANWIGHSLHRNCLLKRVIDVKAEGNKNYGATRKKT